MPLTILEIKNAKATGKDLKLADGKGLYLRVHKSGAKTWNFRYSREGRDCWLSLGDYPGSSLTQARSLATAQRDLLARGIDPADERDRQHAERAAEKARQDAAQSVADLAEAFYKRHILPTFKRPEEPRRIIDAYILPTIGSMKVEHVTRAHIAEVLALLVDRGATVMANRTLPILKKIFAYGVELGAIDDSPAALLSRRMTGGKEKSRDRYLSTDEIRAVWRLLDDLGDRSRISWQYRAAIKLLLLSGQRVGELLNSRWDHFDLEAGEWTIPETKNGKAHLVHLSEQALAVLNILPSRSDPQGFVFPSAEDTSKPFSVRAISQASRKLFQSGRLAMPPWTPHDLRRTFVTHLAGLGIAPHVIEKCVNHELQGVLATYQRSEYLPERRAAFQQWGSHLEVITSDYSNVVPFQAHQA
jgi:integrase